MKDLLKKYAIIVKEYETGGIVVTYHKDFTQAKCTEYIQKEPIEGYKKPLVRTAKQEASIMGFTQIY